ncbi:hypothetical protein L207DRAFT_567934 [Hyaloscypha variabilis F]|uniref:F-box domain-containing protein n=1 Tax=Hyaloscypha variabilis (strain UAMH 11265 / GT02V1 / F) TaxID=1149755 RepID=A0A2J6RIA1_HYAVF|nr:hypothetical protein L207DRAFT_567934 [Hyaloscypha variabilis F]
MGQVAKRFTFGHDSSSSNNTLQRRLPSKMIQTSILRYITSDREHLKALNSSSFFLRLPYSVRKRIYEYAGLTDGHFICLNYDYPSFIDGHFSASDAWYELALLDDIGSEVEDQIIDYEDEDDIESVEPGADDDESEVFWISEYSQNISRFLDGPMPHYGLPLNRVPPRCCKISGERGDCNCKSDNPSFPSPLLDVCRQISNEVAYLFYSGNHFHVCQTSDGGFSGLLSIKPTALSWLTSLSIDLSICECVSDAATDNFSGGCSRHWPACCIPGSQKFVQSAVLYRKYKEMIHWKALCLHLAVSITPHQLKLWIRCELDKIETAKEIISPLKALPVLRSCGIRFNSDPFATELQDLAREIALELTDRRSYALDCPFRYLDLPREIQLQVLQYTDLVTRNDIAWCSEPPYEGPQVFETSSLRWECNAFTSEDLYYEFKCCGKCSDGRESCCCFLIYTASSTTCTCWRMPSSLFLVNRQMREDSTAIFFSQNHFLILPVEDIDPDQSLEILQFFYKFAIRGRKYVQSVTWMLPEFDYMHWNAGSLGDWVRALDICVKELSLQRVTFTIDLSFQARRRLECGLSYNGQHRPLPISQLEEREWNIGLVLAASMGKHKQWKNVYFHLSWPWHNPHNRHDPYTSSKEAQVLRHHQEAVLEQQVMGPDYVAEGKYNRRHAWNSYICKCEDCGGEDW